MKRRGRKVEMKHKKSVVNEDDSDPIKFLNVLTEENKKAPQDSALEMVKVQEKEILMSRWRKLNSWRSA